MMVQPRLRQWSTDTAERRARQRNIDRFIEQLDLEQDANKRAALHRLLLAEVDSYGSRAERLDLVNSLIAGAKARVESQERLFEAAGPELTRLLQKMLEHFRATLELFVTQRQRLLDDRDRV